MECYFVDYGVMVGKVTCETIAIDAFHLHFRTDLFENLSLQLYSLPSLHAASHHALIGIYAEAYHIIHALYDLSGHVIFQSLEFEIHIFSTIHLFPEIL